MFFFGSSKPVHDTWLAQLPPANASTTEFRRWIAVWGADSGRSKEIQKIRPSLWWGDTIRALTDSQMHEQLQAHGLERTIALSLAHDIERAKLLEMRKFTARLGRTPQAAKLMQIRTGHEPL